MPQDKPQTLSPGEVLKKNYLKPNGWTSDQLASVLMMPVQEVRDLINGELSITEMRACHLAAGLNTSKEFWIQLERLNQKKRKTR